MSEALQIVTEPLAPNQARVPSNPERYRHGAQAARDLIDSLKTERGISPTLAGLVADGVVGKAYMEQKRNNPQQATAAFLEDLKRLGIELDIKGAEVNQRQSPNRHLTQVNG